MWSFLPLFLATGMVDSFNFDEAALASDYSAQEFARPFEDAKLRTLMRLPSGDMIGLYAVGLGGITKGKLVIMWDDDNDGVADGFHCLGGDKYDLTHGLEYIEAENSPFPSRNSKLRNRDMGYLLASSDNTVFAWSFPDDESSRTRLLGIPKILVRNINEDIFSFGGSHRTRTLALTPGTQQYLYVSIGTYSNVDSNSYRSRIRRFDLSTMSSEVDYFMFGSGEVFVDGVRNNVGMAFDSNSTLWGVEMGRDRLNRDDLGGDISKDNPADEMNAYSESLAGQSFGYPWCWTEFKLGDEYSQGNGAVFADPTFSDFVDDAWCRANTQPSDIAFQAHSSPTGITFYEYNETVANDENCSGTFPQEVDGNAYVAFHGSWNRSPATGYKVVQVPFDTPGGQPTGEVLDLFAHNGESAIWGSGIRPTDVEFDKCGRLLVTDDSKGYIFTISHDE